MIMKIKIESDVFDIIKRIKEIDENYFVIFNTYCFTYPYENLDNRIIDLIYFSNVSNIDNIVEDIDNNNAKIEKDNMNSVKSSSDYMVREIYNFSKISSKNLDELKAFSSVWR